MAQRVPIDPDKGVNDLVRQLADDSKGLLGDEVRLAKLESAESMHRAGRGALWIGAAFGVAVVMLVAFTLFLATLIGRIAAGHMWVGALVTGVLELVIAVLLLRRGLDVLRQPSYTLEETRTALKDTAVWARSPRS